MIDRSGLVHLLLDPGGVGLHPGEHARLPSLKRKEASFKLSTYSSSRRYYLEGNMQHNSILHIVSHLAAAQPPAGDPHDLEGSVQPAREGAPAVPLAGVHPAVRVAGTQHLGDDGLAAVHVLLLARLLLHQGKFGGPQTFSVDGRES